MHHTCNRSLHALGAPEIAQRAQRTPVSQISDGLIFRDSLVVQVNDRSSDSTSGLGRYVKPLSTLIEVWNVL